MPEQSTNGTNLDDSRPTLTAEEGKLIWHMVQRLPDDRVPTSHELAEIHSALAYGGIGMTRTATLLNSLITVSDPQGYL